MKKRHIGPGMVVAMFIVGLFAFGLLIFTGIANLKLLTSIYPDPQFVGFGLLALEGGVIVWSVVSFLTNKHSSHFGICILGLGIDTLLSFTGFMYELSAKTGQNLPIELPVIYVVGFAVIFNIGAGICYKLVPYNGPAPTYYLPQGEPGYAPQAYGQYGYMPYGYLPPQQGGATGNPLASGRGQPKEAPASLENRDEVPQQSPVKRLPPLQTHQQDTIWDVFKDGLAVLTHRG